MSSPRTRGNAGVSVASLDLENAWTFDASADLHDAFLPSVPYFGPFAREVRTWPHCGSSAVTGGWSLGPAAGTSSLAWEWSTP